MFNATIDTSDFLKLTGKAKIAFTEGLIAGVDFGMTELPKAFVKNLMGVSHRPGTPSPYPGKLPVTRITGQLSKSVAIKRVNPVSGLVFVDEHRAEYADYVHDGTRRMAPRPYAREAVSERRPAILQRTAREVKKRMDKL